MDKGGNISLTVNVSVLDPMLCGKCGSRMAYRKRKTSRGAIITIKQCIVCRHYESISPQ